MVAKIIIDSNFFFIPSEFQIDILEDLKKLLNQKIDPILLSITHLEILKLAEKGHPKLRQQALLALKFSEKCRKVNVESLPGETNDDTIVRVAKDWNCFVATNDGILRKKLRKENVTTIFLRQRAFLDYEGAIQ